MSESRTRRTLCMDCHLVGITQTERSPGIWRPLPVCKRCLERTPLTAGAEVHIVGAAEAGAGDNSEARMRPTQGDSQGWAVFVAGAEIRCPGVRDTTSGQRPCRSYLGTAAPSTEVLVRLRAVGSHLAPPAGSAVQICRNCGRHYELVTMALGETT